MGRRVKDSRKESFVRSDLPAGGATVGSLTALVRPRLQAQIRLHLDFPRTRVRAPQTMVSCPQQKAAEFPRMHGCFEGLGEYM